MLKEEAHLFSDCSQLVQPEPGDVLAVDEHRTRVGLFNTDNQPEQYALPGTAASKHGQSLSAAHIKAYPIQDLVSTERFMQMLDFDKRRRVVSPYILLNRIVISYCHVRFSRPFSSG